MSQSVIGLWESITQASVELLKNAKESNQSAVETLLNGQSGLSAWGKLAKSSLDATQAIVDMNTSALNKALQNEVRGKELETVADSVEELGGIVGSLATSLTELQVSTFNSILNSYANSLRSLKNAVSTEEMMAVQAHLQEELQEKIKASATETLQTLNSLNSGLMAWFAQSVDKLAEEKSADLGTEPKS